MSVKKKPTEFPSAFLFVSIPVFYRGESGMVLKISAEIVDGAKTHLLGDLRHRQNSAVKVLFRIPDL